MTNDSFVIFAMLMASATMLVVSILFLYPEVARARFVDTVSILRDQIDDAVIEGRLAYGPAVEYEIQKLDFLRDNYRRLTFSLLTAIHLTSLQYTAVAAEAELQRRKRALQQLPREQRAFLESIDDQLVVAISAHIGHGSRFALPLLAARRLVGGVAGVRTAVRKSSLAGTQSLAQEYNRLAQSPVLREAA